MIMQKVFGLFILMILLLNCSTNEVVDDEAKDQVKKLLAIVNENTVTLEDTCILIVPSTLGCLSCQQHIHQIMQETKDIKRMPIVFIGPKDNPIRQDNMIFVKSEGMENDMNGLVTADVTMYFKLGDNYIVKDYTSKNYTEFTVDLRELGLIEH